MEGSVQVFVRRQFETDDDALRISLDTMDDLLALMEMVALCRGADPVQRY